MLSEKNFGLISDKDLKLSSSDTTTERPVFRTLLQWAEAVAVSPEAALPLRSSVLELYDDLPAEIGRKKYWGVGDYGRAHDWQAVAPALREVAVSISRMGITEAGFELLGLTDVVLNAIREPKIDGLYLDPIAYGARQSFVEDFQNDEDWLSTMGRIVSVDGKQFEAEAKEQAKRDNTEYLLKIPMGKIELVDIENIYTHQTQLVYPGAKNPVVFREVALDIDRFLNMYSENKNLFPFLNLRTANRRVMAVKKYLHWYYLNLHINNNPGQDLAWTYGTYLVIHPHLDGNGSMARTLVDHYTQRKGLRSIDWSVIKTDEAQSHELHEAWEAFVYKGDQVSLQKWFEEKVW